MAVPIFEDFLYPFLLQIRDKDVNTKEMKQALIDQSPQFFEHLVVDLLVKMGYGGSFANSAKVTQYVHDDGIDGIIYEDKLGLDKIYIQAKRYKPDNTIGKPQIQQFAGALHDRVQRGCKHQARL